jgi:hypothetical protein
LVLGVLAPFFLDRVLFVSNRVHVVPIAVDESNEVTETVIAVLTNPNTTNVLDRTYAVDDCHPPTLLKFRLRTNDPW